MNVLFILLITIFLAEKEGLGDDAVRTVLVFKEEM
jgi:hypothetical protein